MKTLIKLFLLALTVGLALSRHSIPLQSEITTDYEESAICSTECTEGISNGNVLFDENRKYVYMFSGKTTIIAPTGTNEGISEVSIKGRANIIGTQKCGAILYVKQIEITQGGSKTYGKGDLKELEGNPILFSYNNGKIGQNFCSLPRDSTASLNFKRAILSALQVSSVQENQKDLFETDIQGTCNTTYYPWTSSDSQFTITKDKDLTQCTGHDKINLLGLSSTQSYPIYKDSPFSTAVQSSEIKIKESTLVSVANKETFLYQPLSAIDVVTKIMVSMTIQLAKMSTFRPPDLSRLSKSRSIMFENPTAMIGLADVDALIAATKLALTKLEPIVDMDGANSFSNLIQLLKVAKKDDILSTFQMIKSGSDGFEDNNVAEDIFIDALIAANSGESIEAAVELIDSQQLSDSLTISWFNNLANAKNPTKEAVVKASSLLSDRALKEGYLGVGALLRQYLQDTQDFNSPEVANTLNNLGNPLKKVGYGSLSANDEDLIIASLRSIGYVQYINNDLEDLIIQITMDKNTIQRIKAASLAMLKIYAKNSKVEKACENIFTDTLEDSELRILAFKVFAINPTNSKASVIKDVLDDKNTQLQIRAYLLSYLSNLQTTADEDKLDQKQFYEGIMTKSSKKPLNDILRYSQKLEYYYQCPLLHSGFLLDGEVIYSYKTFLARSSSASLKTYMFGRKYDVFNIDVRFENLEPLLEKLFGPEGYFAKSKGSTFDDVKNYVTQAINYAKNSVDSESYSKQDCENIPEEEMKKMYIDIALKLFGNDLGWFTFQGNECQITYQHIIDVILKNFDNSITEKKSIELNIRKQIPIVDFENKYATCSGLPVSLKIQATSAIKFDIATTFDLESYFKHPENSNFALKLIPSGSLDFNSLLTIDGYTVDVGYKVSSSLHTSTGSDFSLEMVQNRGFQMVYGLPLDVMDILTIKSGAYSIVQEKGSQSIEIPLSSTDVETKSYTRTFDKFKDTSGLSFYINYDCPWNGELKSLLPFSGPSSFSLKILKVDENLTKYVVKGNYDFNSPILKYIKFIFVTPDANIKRGLELVVVYDTKAHKKILAEFKTPFTKKILQGTLVNSDEQKTIEVKYIDGSQHIFNAGVKCETVDAETIKYSPIFEAKYSTEVSTKKHRHHLLPVFDIEGYVLVKHNTNPESNYPTKLTLRDIAVVTTKSRHSLQGSFTFENNEISGDVSLTANSLTINMKGLLSGDYPIFKMNLHLDMTRNEQANQQLETDESYDNKPTSKFIALLRKVKTLNLLTSHELHIEAPYVFLSNHYIRLDDDYLEANCDILIENNEPTIHGNISASNVLDLAFNGNITVLPITEDTGLFIRGILENSLVSDSSNTGYRDFKYVQNKNKKGSYFEFNSEYPQTFGKYHINTEQQFTDNFYKYTLHYDIHDGSTFTIDMNVLTDDIAFNINYDSPNPEYKSYMIVHGWLEARNTYAIDTNVLWPGDQNSNYLNATGKILLNGRQIHMNGNIDFPLAHLVNVRLSVKSKPDPEIEDGGFASVRYISNNEVLLSEKFKYKLTLNDDEFYVSGESIPDKSQNVKPISFEIMYKNYIDEQYSTGKQIAYKIALEQNNQQILYQKLLQVTNRALNYRQIHKIDDEEQNINMNLEYDIISLYDWSYNLIFKVNSPSIFHYLTNDDQNVLEFRSYIKFGNYSLDEDHTLQIYSSDVLTDSYELKWFTNYEKTAFKFLYKQREIRGLAHYSLDHIKGGYNLNYEGQLWLDYKEDSNSESSLSINSHYSLEDGLSAASDIKIYVPLFNNKEMGVKTDVQMLKSWENPLNILLELDIFSSTKQTLKLHTSLNRDIQDSGVLYSASLEAESDGMKLDYAVKDSLYISSEKWGKYLDVRFVDSNNTVKPIQLHFELVPKGFTNKINIFDIAVIDVDSSIMVKDGVLNTRSNIHYNERPYSFELSLTANPSFKFIMGWEDKKGSHEQLMVDGSIVMDESAVISATRVQNNGNDVIPVGYVKKSLNEENWWETNNHLSTEQTNEIWQSLKGQFIEIFINVHSNIKNIIDVAKQQRKVRFYEARKAQPQYRALVNYTCDEFKQILQEVLDDDYLQKVPMLIQNTIEAVFSDVIDFIDQNGHYFRDSIRYLNRQMEIYLKKIYKYYSEQANILMNKLARDIDELIDQVKLTIRDILRQLNLYTDEPMNDMQSSEPRSVKEYYDSIMDKLMKAIEGLEDKINNIKDLAEDYIKSLSIYDQLQDKIEELKSYPFKEKLWEEIHKYLQELEKSAPTIDFASFIKALDNYINNVIHDIPVSQRDIITLRNKGLIVVKSMIFDFSNYVDHERAMNIYNALRKLTNFGQTILHIASPNTFPYPTSDKPLLFEFNEYNMQLYHKYANPSNLIPPYDVQSVIIDSTNIITYNGQPYSFMPNTGCYTLAEDYVNNKFSILAYYENNILIKLSISTYNGETYELLPGGSITVNGKDADFPLINDNLKTWKDVYYFEIDIAVGVSIKCTLDFNIIQVFINGYYYGQVRGLLGSMYQEPKFDFNLPNGELSNDMASFLSAYGQSGNTEPTNIDLLQTDQPLCSSLFSGKSSLKPFFQAISPTAYRTICNQIVSSATSEQDSLDKACLVAKAFVSTARQNFMSNCDIPDMCITTSIHERTIDATTNVQISEPNDVADVMILFEETVEIEQTFSKMLNPFMKKLTSNFNSKGINDVKFIIVGYSGKSTDSEVHMYATNDDTGYTKIMSNMPEWTSDAQTTTTDDDVETSSLQSQLIYSFKKVMGQNSKDKAYKLSADYPYRANAIKVVLSVAQSLYDAQSPIIGVSQYTFNYVTSCYTKQGISFYLIAPINLSDNSDDGIFGASGVNTIYTVSSPNGKSSDNEYTYNKSIETNLVLMTSGTMYDSRTFTQITNSQLKIFLHSICKTIVGTSVSDSVVEKSCSSSLYNGVMPYAKCVVVTN
ncbi:apolipophorins [Rhopalosiphum maidis]|uniref:apolipophorins n=1 Tax=Rhopalosiphum maidis TaxID=43146 RepID=UPI000EFE0F15|nr:apolipophorins [Rhopalosiphum maidis]